MKYEITSEQLETFAKWVEECNLDLHYVATLLGALDDGLKDYFIKYVTGRMF